MTDSQLRIAKMLRKAGRKVTTIDATDERNVKVQSYPAEQRDPIAFRAADKVLARKGPDLATNNYLRNEAARLIAEEYAPIIEALEECADWLCDAQPHSDPWERGQKARKALGRL